MHLKNPNYTHIRIINIDVVQTSTVNGEKIALAWSFKVPAPMHKVFYSITVCMNIDGDMYCCDCNFVADGRNQESKIKNEKHMVFVHACAANYNFMRFYVILWLMLYVEN